MCEIARWLATAHDDADVQRTHAQEQLERHTLARYTHCLPPILSRAPTHMDTCPQQLFLDRTVPWILKMAAADYEDQFWIYQDFPKCMCVPTLRDQIITLI